MGAAPILTILRDGETVKSLAIEGESVLGRSEGCVIRLEDRAISRQHAVFRPTSEGIQVERKSEFAPLTVNGAECSRAIVKDGDVIAMGPYLMKLTTPKASRPEPAEPAAAAPGASPDGATVPIPLSELELPNTGASGAGEALPGMGAGMDIGGAGMELGASDAEVALPDAGAEPAGEELAPAPSPLPEVNEPSAIIQDDAPTRVMANQSLVARLILPPNLANVTDFELKLAEGGEIGIGRGKNCEIVLKDKKSSRRNSVIRLEGGRYVIKDLQSANGTWVNGEQVEEQVLNSDDEIKIGAVTMTFFAESADYAERERDFMKVPDVETGEYGAEDAGYGSAPRENPLEFRAPEGSPDVYPGFPGDPAAAQPTGGFQAPGFAPASPAPGHPGGGDLGSMAGVPGIAGIGPGSSGKKLSLYQRFKALPPRRRLFVGLAVLAIVFYGILEDDEPDNIDPKTGKKIVTKKNQKNAKGGVTAGSGAAEAAAAANFESLPEKDRQFVLQKHELAFSYYKNHEYDKSLYELSMLHEKLPGGYLDSREIERYAKESKRMKEQMDLEKRLKEEELQRKKKVELLVDEAASRMKKKQYEQAREIFGQILPLDPENAQVQSWRKEIEYWEDEQRLLAEQAQVRKEINTKARDILKEGIALEKKARYRTAIGVFAEVRQLNPPDGNLLKQASAHIARCRAAINALRDPVLAEAKQLEGAGEFAKAFPLFQKATVIDPDHPEGYAGMNRIRGILHDRAKLLYTEAVLAESYSDFNSAKRKYSECLRTAPNDDIYHERAQRKLARFLKQGEETPQ